jgi:hypothetical protein
MQGLVLDATKSAIGGAPRTPETAILSRNKLFPHPVMLSNFILTFGFPTYAFRFIVGQLGDDPHQPEDDVGKNAVV